MDGFCLCRNGDVKWGAFLRSLNVGMNGLITENCIVCANHGAGTSSVENNGNNAFLEQEVCRTMADNWGFNKYSRSARLASSNYLASALS